MSSSNIQYIKACQNSTISNLYGMTVIQKPHGKGQKSLSPEKSSSTDHPVCGTRGKSKEETHENQLLFLHKSHKSFCKIINNMI